MNRSTSPPCRRQTGSGSGERSGASLFSPPFLSDGVAASGARPCGFGHVAVGFLRATFPLARFRRGLIHQTQDGCRCAVADDGLQRDAAGHVIGGGDEGCVVGAMNRPTSPLRGSGSGERSGASLFSPPPLPAACRFTGFCGWKYTSSTTGTTRGLNPFEIRAGLEQTSIRRTRKGGRLNPFEIRAGLEHQLPSRPAA